MFLENEAAKPGAARAWNLVLDTFVTSRTGRFDNSGASVTPRAWRFDNLQWNLALGAWETQKPAKALEGALSTPESLQNTFPIWINEEGAMVLPPPEANSHQSRNRPQGPSAGRKR